jgi:hypothetical protein
MTGPTVTFETKVWDGDWQALLLTHRIERMIGRCRHDFARRVVHVNNVADPRPAIAAAERLVARGVLSDVVVVADHARAALDFFQVTAGSFGRGYIYSIAELVALFLCRTGYLLHFSGDSMMARGADWIAPAIARMEADGRIKVANPLWNGRTAEVRGESFAEDDAFFTGQGFSDQCYLVRSADFRAAIYGESHPAAARYPAFADNLFEKRVDAWMRSHGHRRITAKHASYRHRNIRRAPGLLMRLGDRIAFRLGV